MDNIQQIPVHVAVIMDGNGRWAKKRGLSRAKGHREGAKAIEHLVDSCLSSGVKYLTLFCFSSENWNRPADEIKALFSLLEEYLKKEAEPFRKKGINVSFIGRRKLLPESTQKLMTEVESKNLSDDEERLHLILAISYGGREEIVDTACRLAESVQKGDLKPESINEEVFSSHLYLPNVPFPDLLVRTSGEKRISNFLLWELAYAEFFFTDTLWPDFSEKDFQEALQEYASRQRRFGKI